MQSLDPERLLFRLECKSVGSMYAFLEHFYQPFGCCLYSRRSRKSSCSHRDEREVTPSFDTFLLMVEAMIASNDLPQASESPRSQPASFLAGCAVVCVSQTL